MVKNDSIVNPYSRGTHHAQDDHARPGQLCMETGSETHRARPGQADDAAALTIACGRQPGLRASQ
jgi:hypothetical protein